MQGVGRLAPATLLLHINPQINWLLPCATYLSLVKRVKIGRIIGKPALMIHTFHIKQRSTPAMIINRFINILLIILSLNSNVVSEKRADDKKLFTGIFPCGFYTVERKPAHTSLPYVPKNCMQSTR